MNSRLRVMHHQREQEGPENEKKGLLKERHLMMLMVYTPLTVLFAIHFVSYVDVITEFGNKAIETQRNVNYTTPMPELLSAGSYNLNNSCQPLDINLLDGFHNNTVYHYIADVSGLSSTPVNQPNELFTPYMLRELAKDVASAVEYIITFFKGKDKLYRDPLTNEGDDHNWYFVDYLGGDPYKPPRNEQSCWNALREILLYVITQYYQIV